MHRNSRKPNFDSGEWNKYGSEEIFYPALDLLTKKTHVIGIYETYVNIKDGCIGGKLSALNGAVICLFWEKKIRINNGERKLFYAAYRAETYWQIRRVKEMLPSHIFLKIIDDKIIEINVHLPLITGKEEEFFMKINP